MLAKCIEDFNNLPNKLKIAIYSGQIPSTTFIESLITTVGQHHEILLFGTQTKAVSYANKNIKSHITPSNNWLKLSYNIWRSFSLALKCPKDLLALLKEIKTYNSSYKKWQHYSKLLPIVLYRPDIVHIQWAKSLDDFMLLKTVFGIPMVLSLRGAHINYSPIVSESLAASYRKNFPKVDAFHAVSKAIGLQAEQYGANANTIHVIYSKVPKFFLDAFQVLKPKQDRTIKILSVGRAHWVKGYSYAIHAMAELKKLGYLVEYQIIGIDKPDEELLFLIAELGLKEHILLRPKISQTELLTLMHGQDAMLLSSLEEGIANVVLEAMAVGLPVISTDCGGLSEVVIPNETGFLVPIRNAKAMANAIIDLHNMPHNELQTLTNNAHNLIRSKFNEEENLRRFLKLYQSVLD